MAVATLRRLPAPLAFALADVFTPFMVVTSWLREKRVGRGVNRNLRIVYRDTLTAIQARRMRWAWARHMLWLAVEFARMQNINKDNVHDVVDTSELDELRAKHGNGSGIICVSGHIGYSADTNGPVFVVDGTPLSLEDIERFAQMHEGWQFSLRFADSSADLS